MNEVKAVIRNSIVICGQNVECSFPYLRTSDGDKEMCCPSPLHGRSFVVDKTDNGRYVVSKGN